MGINEKLFTISHVESGNRNNYECVVCFFFLLIYVYSFIICFHTATLFNHVILIYLNMLPKSFKECMLYWNKGIFNKLSTILLKNTV